jgi:hypothetical protein
MIKIENPFPTPDPLPLIQAVRFVLGQKLSNPTPVPFIFEATESAAQHNWKILESHDKNLGKAISAYPRSPLSYGSEFRPTGILEGLFRRYPLWDRLLKILESGVDYPLIPIDPDIEKLDLIEALEKGNSKGAKENPKVMEELINGDVIHAFSLVIPSDKVIEIEGAQVAPMNVANQNSIDERGEIIEKDRLTHNQSWKGSASGLSINSRVIESELQDCMFGHCFLRLCHQIVDIRRRHPHTCIFIQKIDWKSAYRRAHYNWRTAIKSITTAVTSAIAYIALRLTFGGKACPNEWSVISETTTDLANDLLRCDEWDPEEIQAPIQKHIPEISRLSDTIPFAPGLPLVVQLPNDDQGKADCYLDDIISIIPEIGDNIKRGAAAVPLAIHLIGRPIAESEPILRDELISMKKLIAEGGLEEIQTVLGWVLNTRELMVLLPVDKFLAYSKQINECLKEMRATFENLDTLTGRLTHVALIIPQAHHFLNRIRHLKDCTKNRRTSKIPKPVADDLHLFLSFLKQAKDGISLNLVTFRKPTHIYRDDACEHGIGGYSKDGRFWRWEIPEELRSRASINILEFVASIISLWVDIKEKRIPPLSCALCMTDNTSGAGWLKRSNFKESEDNFEMQRAKETCARTFAKLCIDAKIKIYSQWFPGKQNIIADSLSRDTHLSDEKILSLFATSPSTVSQLPKVTDLRPLPPEIISWITSLLRTMPVRKQSPQQLGRSELWLGSAGSSSLKESNSNSTHSSKTFLPKTNISSLPLSPTQCEKQPTLQQISTPWLLQQSEIPWTTWHRPSGREQNQTQLLTLTESLPTFYSNSSKAIKTLIQKRNNKKRSHAQFSEK